MSNQAPAPARPSWGRGASRTMGWFWCMFWLIFIIEPIWTSLVSGNTARQRTGGALLLLGALLYVAVMGKAVTSSFWRREASTRSRLGYGAGATSLVVLMLGAVVLLGQPGFSLLPYALVSFAIGVGFPLGFFVGVGVCLGIMLLSPLLLGIRLESGVLFSAIASCVVASLGVYSAQRGLAARRAEEDAANLRLQDERNRMARDVHDILGHSLTVITVKAELASKLIDLDPVAAKAQIMEVEQLSRSALADVRKTVSGYREISLAGELSRARNALSDKGIKVQVPHNVDEVHPELRELFAWSVREGATNVIRHSGAKRCAITVKESSISIADDGRGVVAREGNGLTGLRERAAAVGAEVELTSTNAGCTLAVGIFEGADNS